MSMTQDLRFVTTLFANTVDARRAKVFDQVHGNIPFTAFLMGARSRASDMDGMGKGVVLYTGGGKFRVTVTNATNPNFKWSEGFEGINVATSEEQTDAFEVMRKATSSVGISGDEIDDNQGEHAVRRLLRQKVDVMVMSFKDQLEAALVAGKVGTTGVTPARRFQPVTKGPNPLGYLIQKEGSLTGAGANLDLVHELNQGTETYWRNQAENYAGTSFWAPLRKRMHNMYNNCTAHSDTSTPDFGLCDQAFYQLYEAMMMDNQRFGPWGKSSTAESVGFRGLNFRDMEIFWSKNVPNYGTTTTDSVTLAQVADQSVLFFLNSGALELHVSQRINMRVGNFLEPYDQDAIWGKMLHRTQLVTTQRRKLGVLYDIPSTAIVS